MPALHPPPEPGAPDSRLGPYRLIRPISAGGMARVYEGRLDSLAGVSTRVAIKVIHPDHADESGFQELFINEARVSARLEHQNLVRIQQFNRENELYYLVMEYIDGLTLRKMISLCRRHGVQIPVSLIAEAGRQVCEGLHYAHMATTEAGEPLHLVHRDIKPSNLMLNGQGVVKLLDFGISYAHGADEAHGSVKGTWGYMSLEQADGEAVGPAADLFGLGAVLYELAALEPLFDEKDNGEIRRLLSIDEAARRAAGLGGQYGDLAAVLVRALQRDPAARYSGAAHMGKALAGLVTDPLVSHDGMQRFFTELRAMEGGPAAAPSASARSVSTMSHAPARPGEIPVRTGNLHGVSPAAERHPTRTASDAWLKPLLALALFGASLMILAFGLWRLLVSRPHVDPTPSDAVATMAEAPVPSLSPGAPASAPPARVSSVPPSVVTPTRASPAPTTPMVEHPLRGAARPSEPTEPIRIAPTAAAPAAPVAPAVVVAPVVAAAPGDAAEGMLTISSMPKSQVMIDGQYVKFTPLFQHEVSAGMHTVLLVADDGRRKTFRVDVQSSVETRRIWLFDEERWSDP